MGSVTFEQISKHGKTIGAVLLTDLIESRVKVFTEGLPQNQLGYGWSMVEAMGELTTHFGGDEGIPGLVSSWLALARRDTTSLTDDQWKKFLEKALQAVENLEMIIELMKEERPVG